ncbi:hypothetical protein E3H11_11915 [Bradyrhizobium brasilense]|uniref:hypothetical protein n=1 Tax=Bradyrhizobium brasilense TaxID=1419277 RepID=UPI00145775EE|nr:hypothetical protein [Bradyrhizobium brasilense]NLS69610.1 hypothetical protein [Bradyrhizobium brasilense]
MPVKRRVSKRRAIVFTPEVYAAFDAGDEYALRRALGLPPWHASPLDGDLDGRGYGEGLLRMETRQAALEIRNDITRAKVDHECR